MAERESGIGKAVEKGTRIGLGALALLAAVGSLARLSFATAAAEVAIAYFIWPKQKPNAS